MARSQPSKSDSLQYRLRELGEFAASFEWDRAEDELRSQLSLTLLDTLGVTIAGSRTPEMRSLIAAWSPESGSAQLFGAGRRVAIDSAAYLNGVSAVTLEMDEGNKYARGHPASHVFPAALAVAQAKNASGPELASALVVGHEVASRFGRATRLKPEVHPHGNWGVAGAATATARLMGLDANAAASAIDLAGGLAMTTPWEAVFGGSPVRNAWIGAANLNGIVAARMAAGGVRIVGIHEHSLGEMLGDFDPSELTNELGDRFDLRGSYFKRHSSCSYTHPPADAALKILGENPALDPDRIVSVAVETHSIAAALDRTETSTRMAAMFSIPYVVAVALTTGGCTPEAFDDRHRSNAEIRRLMEKVHVRATEEFDGRLPEERGARVRIVMDSGDELSAEVPNPVGDIAYHPFRLGEIKTKLDSLGLDGASLAGLVEDLPTVKDVNHVLEELP